METHDIEHTTQLIKSDDAGEVVSLRKCQLVVIEGDDKGKKFKLDKPSTKLGKRTPA